MDARVVGAGGREEGMKRGMEGRMDAGMGG